MPQAFRAEEPSCSQLSWITRQLESWQFQNLMILSRPELRLLRPNNDESNICSKTSHSLSSPLQPHALPLITFTVITSSITPEEADATTNARLAYDGNTAKAGNSAVSNFPILITVSSSSEIRLKIFSFCSPSKPSLAAVKLKQLAHGTI